MLWMSLLFALIIVVMGAVLLIITVIAKKGDPQKKGMTLMRIGTLLVGFSMPFALPKNNLALAEMIGYRPDISHGYISI